MPFSSHSAVYLGVGKANPTGDTAFKVFETLITGRSAFTTLTLKVIRIPPAYAIVGKCSYFY